MPKPPFDPLRFSRGAPVIDPAERQRLIMEAAYFIGQKRGDGAGNAVDDWLAAEAQIDGAGVIRPTPR